MRKIRPLILILALSGCLSDHSDSATEANTKIRACAANGKDWAESESTWGIEHVVCDGTLGSRHQSLYQFPD
jgi:uncharacterized protein YceK